MNKESKDKSKRDIVKISIIATLLAISTLSMTITSNAIALDLDNFSIEDLGQSAECVIVVLGCEGTGSVGSSGDTIIGSNNGNNDNNTNNGGGGNEPGTLTVIKQVECESREGTPSDEEVCAYAENSVNFPDPEDFTITLTSSNPNPSTFPGSSTGTPVNLGTGLFIITETIPNLSAIQAELQARESGDSKTAIGDCTTPVDGGILDDAAATGTMTPDGSQECTIINTMIFIGGTVPEAPEI